jgi:hypothetical protein
MYTYLECGMPSAGSEPGMVCFHVHRLRTWTAFSRVRVWHGWFSGTQTCNVDYLQQGQSLAWLVLRYTDLEYRLPSAGSGSGLVDSQVHRLGMWTASSWISAWHGWFSGTQTWNVDCLQLGQGLAWFVLPFTDLERGLPSAGSGSGTVGSQVHRLGM